jgi:hypothetical protein
MKVFYLAMFSVISALSVCGSAVGQVDQPMIVKPKPSNWESFQESTAVAPGILTIKADASDLSCKLHPNVLYATKSGIPLHLHILEPRQREGEERLFPLVVYIQGSASFKQDLGVRNPSIVAVRPQGICRRCGRISALADRAISGAAQGCEDSDSLPEKECDHLQHRS